MTPELAAIIVLILSNLGGLAAVLRLQAQLREACECLGWAERFALGSQDLDPKLQTPTFDKWLIRCNCVSGYPHGKRSAAGDGG